MALVDGEERDWLHVNGTQLELKEPHGDFEYGAYNAELKIMYPKAAADTRE